MIFLVWYDAHNERTQKLFKATNYCDVGILRLRLGCRLFNIQNAKDSIFKAKNAEKDAETNGSVTRVRKKGESHTKI